MDNSNIITDYKNGDNLSKLQEVYGGSRKTIRKILFNEGLVDSIEPERRKYFEGKANVDVKNKLLLRYQEEKNLFRLGEEFGVPHTSIYTLLRKEGIFVPKLYEQRKYPINEHYFDNVDNEEKAYFLGILYADGTNSLKKTEISLRLQKEDYEILAKLNNLLQPTKPLHSIIRDEKRKILYRMVMNSKKISYRLNELGIIPNKTFKLEYPKWLDKKLNKHFIRGYFDGDGSVTFNKSNKYLQISFTGTESIILSIQDILINECGLNKVKLYTRYPERNNNIRMLFYSGAGNSKKFYNYIYNNAIIFMERKKNKFDKHINLN